MNREKHIREMSDIIYENRPIKDIWNEEADSIAENLYNAGYRKQIEVIDEFVERLKEEMKNLARMVYNDTPYYLVGKSLIDRIAEEMKGE